MQEHVDGDGVVRGSYGGLAHCARLWECAVCAARIRAARAEQVRAVVEWHTAQYGPQAAVLVTFTVRHHYGDDLASMSRGVARAFGKRFVKGEAWERFKARAELVGFIRAQDLPTHGENGWHPHLHLVMLTRDPEALLRELPWMRERWAEDVVAELGQAAEPDGHGVDMRPCHRAEYITKLGLELTGGGKRARNGHRNPWQILEDVGAPALVHDERTPEQVQADRVESIYLWQTYTEAMRGAKMLTWTRELREVRDRLCGPERSDEEIVEDNQKGEPKVVLPDATWRRVRDVRGFVAALLTVFERGGLRAVENLLVERLGPAPEGAWALPYSGLAPFS
jgi:hypothetical protein